MLSLLQPNREIPPNCTRSKKDYSNSFNTPQKLYGRNDLITTLLCAFDRASEGAVKMIVLEGTAGTGKSTLVHETRKFITSNNGLFINVKFDQLQKIEPYSAIIDAFTDFCSFLLEETDQIEYFRELIQKALGDEENAMKRIIPDLNLIIGEQSDMPNVLGKEIQFCFSDVFRRFVKVIASAIHPVVLFIDNLQWADKASIDLLAALLKDEEICHLLFVGACRDNEVSESHPYINLIQETEKLDCQFIEVTNLSKRDMNELVADSLNVSQKETHTLTDFLYRKTNGNAFSVLQILKLLEDERLLHFCHEEQKWQWDLKQISESNISHDVVDILSEKILTLSGKTRSLLRMASCIGNSFDLSILMLITEDEKVEEYLEEAIMIGVIIRSTQQEMFQFSHTRFQEAAYSLIPATYRSEVHLLIGRSLLEKLPDEEIENELFFIVNQLNFGLDLVTNAQERMEIVRLSLQAGKKATLSSAFRYAADFIAIGIRLLRQNNWVKDYELSLELYTFAAQMDFCNTDFVDLREKVQQIYTNAASMEDKVEAYIIEINSLKTQGKIQKSIDVGLNALEQFGEKIAKHPYHVSMMFNLVKTKWLLKNESHEDIISMHMMKDTRVISTMDLMSEMIIISHVSWPKLVPPLVFRMIQLTLKFGVVKSSALAFAIYGCIMCSVLERMEEGYRFGQLGLRLADRFRAEEWLARTTYIVYSTINHWNEHVHLSLEPLLNASRIGMQEGSIEFGLFCAHKYCAHSFLGGKPLVELEEEMKEISGQMKEHEQETLFNHNEVYRQTVLNLIGYKNPEVSSGIVFNQESVLENCYESNDVLSIFMFHFNSMILSYLFGEYKIAAKEADESRALLSSVASKFEVSNHAFYDGLISLEVARKDGDNAKCTRIVTNSINKIRKWAKLAPENNLHKLCLLEAELAFSNGKHLEAINLYFDAIELAEKHEFLHEAALAYERAGIFHLLTERKDLASYYFSHAYQAYHDWGADSKMHQLQSQYKKFVIVPGVPAKDSTGKTNSKRISSSTNSSTVDLVSIIKASNSLSGEIKLPQLLRILMNIVLEILGAQRAFLLLVGDKNELFIQAEQSFCDKEAVVLQNIPFKNTDQLAKTVVKYVVRTNKDVVIHDSLSHVRFSSDPFIQEYGAQSIFCTPIIDRGRFIGVIYLDSNLGNAVFSSERVKLLNTLAGQIAISIDNAVLYNDLLQTVEERTCELTEEKENSERLLLNILPKEVAEELKHSNKVKPRYFDSVTVLFTDFKGFTKISMEVSVEELVNEINTCFSAFDEIIGKYNIEKIKTIGDAYMCAGGLPTPNYTHPMDVIRAAVDIQKWMINHKREREAKCLTSFEVRIGVHTGNVVAGVVGIKKFAYDIWGDTVNTASRMESSGQPGKVNISSDTYKLVKDKVKSTYRGEVEAKNKGKIKMYFVDEILDSAENVKSAQRKRKIDMNSGSSGENTSKRKNIPSIQDT